LFAQRFIGHLFGGGGELFALNRDIDGAVFDHVLTPMFALHSGRSGVKFSFEDKKTKLHCARQAALAAGGREIGNQGGAILEVHGPEYMVNCDTTQAFGYLDSLADRGISLAAIGQF
jgi:hypothetical protein